MDRAGVEGAWLVQLLGVYDNTYQAGAAAAHPDRLVSVIQVDATRSDAVAALTDLAAGGARGVRLRPGSRSPGDDPLAIWRAVAALGLVVSCVGTAAQFAAPDFAAVLAEFPALPVVLEHLGGLARPDVGDLAVATPALFGLAAHANVRLKLPGLGQLVPRAALADPPVDDTDPRGALIAATIAAFGSDRLLWASDFPVVSTREGYANALAWTRAVSPAANHAAIFGGNAAALLG
jgi:L-fuconolactonase